MTDLNPVDAMTNLSPAAASIVLAFDDLYEISIFNENWQEECLAAAFRAAADQLRKAYADEEYVDSADDWLDAIAAELDAVLL
jgi:hypothetical protein